MNIEWNTIFYGVVASLIAAAIVGALTFIWGKRRGFTKGYHQGRIGGFKEGHIAVQTEYRKIYEAAIRSFTEEIEKLIQAANRAKKDEQVVANAHAIVSTRDSMRESLTNLRKLLNTEIDTLSNILESSRTAIDKDGSYDSGLMKEIRSVVLTLSKTWPAKRPQIDVAHRRILAEMGLERIINGSGATDR